MKNIALAVVILVLAGCGNESLIREQAPSPEQSQGVELRSMILATPVNELGFTSDPEFPVVYGVLTEWDIDGVTATVVSMRDGMASLYTTSSFGIIGGEGHKSVRQAAVRHVKEAGQFIQSGKPITQFAYPKGGQVFHYLLTYDGVRLIVGKEAIIASESDPTRPLFAAAQDVLTEMRLITEKLNTQAEN